MDRSRAPDGTIRIERRDFLRVALGGGAALLLAACSSQTPAAPKTEAKPAAQPTAAPKPTNPPPAVAKEAPKPTEAAKPAEKPAAQAPAAPAKAGGTFTIVDNLEPNSLDPPVGTDQFGHPIYAMFEGLLQFDDKGQLVKKLATDWEISQDKLEWTFKLRPNVKFHDGTPFTSEAAKFSLERILDPNTKATRRASYTFIEKIETPEALTVKIRTKTPYPDLTYILADRSSMMISPNAAKDANAFGRAPVGTGPFLFKEWRSKERIVMEPFGDYWGEKPKIQSFVFRAVPEEATRTALLRTGEADMVLNIGIQDVPLLKSDQNVVIEIKPTLTTNFPQWSTVAGPFADRRVRQAANLSINREEMLDKVFGGAGSIPRSPAPPSVWGTVELDPIPYDVARAKQLLAEAGHPNGFKGSLYYDKREEKLYQATIAYLRAVGIEMDAKVVEQAERIAMLSTEPEKYPGDIIGTTRSGPYISNYMERLYLCEATRANAAQRSGYCHDTVDELLKKAGTTFETDERAKLYADAQKLLWEDHAGLWIIGTSMVVGYRKGISGFSVLPSREVIVAGVTK